MTEISAPTFYRCAVWLPIAVPAAFAVIVHGLGIRPGTGAFQKIAQLLLASLLYGAVPYTPLALWASWWIGGKDEAQIRRLMFKAPLLMAAVFVPVALLAGFAAGAVEPFAAVAVLGALAAIVLGYAYVALVMLIREETLS